MTSIELIRSWNALGDVVMKEENQDSEFSAQAKRILTNVDIKNEVDYWNALTLQERNIVATKNWILTLKWLK